MYKQWDSADRKQTYAGRGNYKNLSALYIVIQYLINLHGTRSGTSMFFYVCKQNDERVAFNQFLFFRRGYSECGFFG